MTIKNYYTRRNDMDQTVDVHSRLTDEVIESIPIDDAGFVSTLTLEQILSSLGIEATESELRDLDYEIYWTATY